MSARPAKAKYRRNGVPVVTLADLDDIDRHIIDHLQADGRRSNSAIARALGLAEATVRHRIDRLISAGFIRITAVIDPRKTAYKVNAVIWFRVKHGKAINVGKRLASFPNVIYVGHIAGRYDLVMEALFESDEELFEFLTKKLAKLGVESTETCHVLGTVKINYDWKVPLNHKNKDREVRR
jgi:Lrp/AsnC family transcriptional regulator, regulator for asnA, asnC and gidA